MREWIRYSKLAPKGYQALLALHKYAADSGLEQSLLELVRLRVSQINSCAYCIDIHTKDARVAGESEQRLYCLTAWWETPFYTDRERAALAWTEAIMKIKERQIPTEVYEDALARFSEKELVDLTMEVIAFNGTNWMAIAFNTPTGSYHRERPVTIHTESEPAAA